MTSARTVPSTNGSGSRGFRAARAEVVGPVLQRRWGRVVVGVGAAVLGAWVFAAVYLSAGDRHEVVVVAQDVEQGDVLGRGDVLVVRMPEEPGVEMVPAEHLEDVVGRVAAVDLYAGGLLADDQLAPDGSRLPGEDEAVVGVVLAAGEGPVGALARGAPVVVVLRPLPGEEGELREVEGWVQEWSDERGSGERPVEVVVPRDVAGEVSAGAADRRVSVVGLAGR